MADKEETVVLRMSGEVKAAIKAAADSVGQSMTTFITDAALKKAHQTRPLVPPRAGQTGVPAHFRALCSQAANGGANGYATPGWHLAASVGAEVVADLGRGEGERQLDALMALLANRDDEGTWQWFQERLAKHMALIPPRRREQFLYGVRRAYDENLIEA